MSFFTVFLLAVALSMDAFAVALASGCAIREVRLRQYVRVSAAFGFFQFFMPVLGWFLGQSVHHFIEAWDHWLAFVLLAWIGGNMIHESRAADDEDEAAPSDGQVKHKELLVLAVATSIDALAVGVTFSMVELSVSIGLAVALIGCTTFVISLAGVYVGNVFGARYKNKAEFVGGAILILIGVKILLEHFGVL